MSVQWNKQKKNIWL